MAELGKLHWDIATVLEEVAREQTTITYGDLCAKVHYSSPRRIGNELAKLDDISYPKYKTFVSCLVVQKDSPSKEFPLPSEPFFSDYLTKSGQSGKDWFVFEKEQLELTYGMDWGIFLNDVKDAMNS